MAQDTRSQLRNETERRRRAPPEPTHVLATFDHGGQLGGDTTHGPIELAVEVTDPDGKLADWFDDNWWTEVLQRWGDDPVTLRMAPTPQALLHPTVLHHLEMLRRVAPRWRIVGHAYVGDVASDEAVATAAGSAYHEIRFLDRPRPGASASDRADWQLPLAELFGRIRQAQIEMNATAPILVRLPGEAAGPAPTPPPTQCSGASTTGPRFATAPDPN
ncbi:MAG: hypothetical protein IIC01_08320 [Planctomycetes bacterium]|nr:hypothetical protein [Planctomycetota bacterium]